MTEVGPSHLPCCVGGAEVGPRWGRFRVGGAEVGPRWGRPITFLRGWGRGGADVGPPRPRNIGWARPTPFDV